jgi:hypothetical protein
MGIVHVEVGLICLGKSGQVTEGSKIAVHAEDPVGHDQRSAAETSFREQPGQVLHVVVPVNSHVGAAQTTAIDQAGMTEAVCKDQPAGADESGDGADVRKIARPQRECGFCALEPGKGFFEMLMRGQRAGY